MSPRAYTIVSTGLIVSVANSIPRGLLTGSNPLAVSGQRATATVPTATITPTSHAKYRQRGEGGRPSGKSNARYTKSPRCTTHSQEETQANVSPPGSRPSGDPGSASNVTMAYSATKSRIPATRPMVQKSQPTGLWGGRRGATTAPAVEKLTTITAFTSQ